MHPSPPPFGAHRYLIGCRERCPHPSGASHPHLATPRATRGTAACALGRAHGQDPSLGGLRHQKGFLGLP